MSLTVRVVAPTGRDAELIVEVLQQHGLKAEACRDALPLLEAASREPIGPLLIAEESLTKAVTQKLVEVVHEQPAWSDFPIVILTMGARSVRRGRTQERYRHLGLPILLERPIRTETMVSSLRAAVRARMRQYEVRDALAARDGVLAELRTERDFLRTSEERFRRLIENASVSINISDVDGRITYANPALLRLIGYTAEEVERGEVRWDELTPPEFAEADRLATERMLETGTCVPYQKAYRARDGRIIPLLVGMTLLPSSSKEPQSTRAAVFLTDLTQQKQAETALVQSEKLAAVGRLAASISHEINNPLEAVTNLLYLVKEHEGLPPEMHEYMSLAELELARVSQIATHTLRFHRQSTRPREVPPQELIQSVVALHQGRLLNSRIEVVYQERGADPIVCYEGDIRQVLNNLVGNAIDSMRTGGRLVVRMRNGTLWQTGRRGVRITVADTGHGMSAEVRARIFDAFYTTQESNGTGLGLWISKGIIEKHEGRLRVWSTDRQPCTGTVFSVFLPRELSTA
ncbi:MAG TPA: ATP-binding protein [Acidobacteriaceae bacterium]|nr:ATP-binding protein [Acidobacteriaceae bacterium]